MINSCETCCYTYGWLMRLISVVLYSSLQISLLVEFQFKSYNKLKTIIKNTKNIMVYVIVFIKEYNIHSRPLDIL